MIKEIPCESNMKKFQSLPSSRKEDIKTRVLADFDPKELQLPQTTFIRDIENKVLQAIALQAMSKIEGISFLEGNLIDNLLGREVNDRIKGVYVEQDQKNHSIEVRVEVNIFYGMNIPKKANEIQEKIVQEISTMTGLHVSSVHVIFKNLIPPITKEELKDEEALNN